MDGRVRVRRLVCVVAAVLVMFTPMVVVWPATAAPPGPGAAGSPPKQASGSAAGRPHKATARSTTATGSTAAVSASRPKVPGAVGAQRRYPVPVAVKVYVAGDRFASETFLIDNSPNAYTPLPPRR